MGRVTRPPACECHRAAPPEPAAKKPSRKKRARLLADIDDSPANRDIAVVHGLLRFLADYCRGWLDEHSAACPCDFCQHDHNTATVTDDLTGVAWLCEQAACTLEGEIRGGPSWDLAGADFSDWLEQVMTEVACIERAQAFAAADPD